MTVKLSCLLFGKETEEIPDVKHFIEVIFIHVFRQHTFIVSDQKATLFGLQIHENKTGRLKGCFVSLSL